MQLNGRGQGNGGRAVRGSHNPDRGVIGARFDDQAGIKLRSRVVVLLLLRLQYCTTSSL